MTAPTLNYLCPVPGEPKWFLVSGPEGAVLSRSADAKPIAVSDPIAGPSQVWEMIRMSVLVRIAAFAMAAALLKRNGGPIFLVAIGITGRMVLALVRMAQPTRQVSSIGEELQAFSIDADVPFVGRRVRDSRGELLGRLVWRQAYFTWQEERRCWLSTVAGRRLVLRICQGVDRGTHRAYELRDRQTQHPLAWVRVQPSGLFLSLPADQPLDLDPRLLAALLYSVP